MAENQRYSSLHSRSPSYWLFIALWYIIIIGGCTYLALLIPAIFIFEPATNLLNDPSYTPVVKDIIFLQYSLISRHLSFFVIPGVLLLVRLKRSNEHGYPELVVPSYADIGLTVVLTFCLLPMLGFTAELNSLLKFSGSLSGLQEWVVKYEIRAERISEIILSRRTAGYIIVNFIMMTVMPALSEELIFRGILQRIFSGIFRSGYAGVIFTAVLFSALHLQFMGFLPRFLIGMACGLLFLWSGKLWLPVIVHFINNAMAQMAYYSIERDVVADTGILDLVAHGVMALLLFIPFILIMNKFRNRATT